MWRGGLSWTEELAKASTCARDRRALQQLALNVHVQHSDMAWPDVGRGGFGWGFFSILFDLIFNSYIKLSK